MENNNSKNIFDNQILAVVLILVAIFGYFLINRNSQNPQQNEIDSLKAEVENLKNNNSGTSSIKTESNPSVITKQKSLTDIIDQWRKSTAYVECYWIDSNTHKPYLKQSGSGLLFMLGNDVPTIITNKHVVNNPDYGIAQECDAVFPGDKYAFYGVRTTNSPAYIDEFGLSVPSNSAHGEINISSAYDSAYLTNLKEYGTTLVPPSISLSDRAVRGNFPCASEAKIGDPLIILGYPSYGSGAGTITSVFSGLEITATEGIVSGKDGGYYTTSAKIEHGNSGGLAVDKNNNCYLGIPTASFTGEIESLGRILPASYIFNY